MYEKMKAKVNWPVTILLFVGLLTVAFPLYMTIVIAFKQPSEMTNSISVSCHFRNPGVSATLSRQWNSQISGDLLGTVFL